MITQRSVLNVGSGACRIALPAVYAAWRKVFLDINPVTKPDVLCDARQMVSLPAGTYDSVYSSHLLEHFYAHEVPNVLSGFRHVLKSDGFVFLLVPDIGGLMQEIVEKRLGLLDTLYTSEVGPINARDVLYGHAGRIAQDDGDWQAHKTGFTQELLGRLVRDVFPNVYVRVENREIQVIASMVAEVRLAA